MPRQPEGGRTRQVLGAQVHHVARGALELGGAVGSGPIRAVRVRVGVGGTAVLVADHADLDVRVGVDHAQLDAGVVVAGDHRARDEHGEQGQSQQTKEEAGVPHRHLSEGASTQ